MAKTDVKLYATDSYAKATTTTISDVNPEATSSQLVQMGRLFNNLTDNTYSKTDRINTINCDTESGGEKQPTTLSLAQTSVSITDLTNGINGGEIAISTNSDGVLYIQQLEIGGLYAQACIQYIEANSTWYLKLTKVIDGGGNTRTTPQTLTIYQAESETHQAATVTLTLTA